MLDCWTICGLSGAQQHENKHFQSASIFCFFLITIQSHLLYHGETHPWSWKTSYSSMLKHVVVSHFPCHEIMSCIYPSVNQKLQKHKSLPQKWSIFQSAFTLNCSRSQTFWSTVFVLSQSNVGDFFCKLLLFVFIKNAWLDCNVSWRIIVSFTFCSASRDIYGMRRLSFINLE